MRARAFSFARMLRGVRSGSDEFEMSGHRQVIVVGAGLAGLAAAYTLRRRGIDVTVFEASSYPGGRVLGREVDGFHIDVGANLFLDTFGAVRQLADDLGIRLERTRVPVHGGIYRNGRFHGLYGGDRFASQFRTMATLLSFRLLSPGGTWRAFRFISMLQSRSRELSLEDPSRILDLDTGESAAEFVESRFGSELLERLVGPSLAGYVFGHPERIGAVRAMSLLWQYGLNGAAWPILPRGGTEAFGDALVRACEGSIRTSTPVRDIVIRDGVARGVVTASGVVEADAVICATTATGALEIAPALPSDIRSVLSRVAYSRCCRVFFGVDSNPLPQDWYGVMFPRDTGTLIAGVSNATALRPESAPEGKTLIDALLIEEGADRLSALDDDHVAAQVLEEVRRFLPAMAAVPLFAHVHRWPEAGCLVPGGAMKALHEIPQQLLHDVRGLFLAGEYMGVPSTNGALRSGVDAANDCAELFAPRHDLVS